jgi:microcompartment protein CcmK/EutM
MHFARVIGTVVCTEKVSAFRAQRMLLLEPVDSQQQPVGRPLVAIDLVSAAPGQHVFYVRGREAANALSDPDNPADAAIVGIVDEVRDQGFDDPTPALAPRSTTVPSSGSGAAAPAGPAKRSRRS